MKKQKNKILLLSLVAMFSASLAGNAFALESDRNQPVKLEADSADLNQSTGVHVFTGHVVVQQGTAKLTAARAAVKTDQQNKLIRAVAHGSDSAPAHFTSVQKQGEPPVIAIAKTITYLAKQNKIILKGHASVQQGTDKYKAPEIIYDMQKRHVVSHANKKQRISIIIHPKKGNNKHKLFGSKPTINTSKTAS